MIIYNNRLSTRWRANERGELNLELVQSCETAHRVVDCTSGDNSATLASIISPTPESATALAMSRDDNIETFTLIKSLYIFLNLNVILQDTPQVFLWLVHLSGKLANNCLLSRNKTVLRNEARLAIIFQVC